MSIEPGRASLRVVAAAIFDDSGRILISQRTPGRELAGRWEFPGGKVAAGESDPTALARELAEELGIELRSARKVMELTHPYPDKQVTLAFYSVADYRGEVSAREGQALRWLAPAELDDWDILEADRPFVLALQSAAGSAS
ncbi:MAG: (deoxy)nucleoside triphosphate pyrophosphohydrolase [Steroidobacteraceae bacterium]